MIANNKLILNQATMQEAIQFWLDSKTLEPLARVNYVASVDASQTFTISLISEAK